VWFAVDVPEVGCRALIAPVSYFQWLQGAVRGEILYHGITRGSNIPHRARGVKDQGFSAGESP